MSGATFRRFFNWNTSVDEVDWTDWGAVVDAFQSRVVNWYFRPLEDFPDDGHEAFPVLCSMCAVIGASAYYLRHGGREDRLAVLTNVGMTLDQAERFLSGVHESILDTGGLSSVGMTGSGELALDVGDTLVFDPWVLRDRLRDRFVKECSWLREGPDSEAAECLRSRLESDLGVEVGR